MPVQAEGIEDYKTKYRTLKRKLKILIYENECFQEELRKANRALLRVKQDKSFLLDQLLPVHQPLPSSDTDSDLTDHSDHDAPADPPRPTAPVPAPTLTHGYPGKRKRAAGEKVSGLTGSASTSPLSHLASAAAAAVAAKHSAAAAAAAAASSSGGGGGKKRRLAAGGKSGAVAAAAAAVAAAARGTMTKQVGGGGVRAGGRGSALLQRSPHKILAQATANNVAVMGGTTDGGVDVCDSVSGGGGGASAAAATAAAERELSREEVERHLAERQPLLTDFSTAVSLTLPNQLFSDNILDGDLLGEEIETSPSNLNEDITVDNYD